MSTGGGDSSDSLGAKKPAEAGWFQGFITYAKYSAKGRHKRAALAAAPRRSIASDRILGNLFDLGADLNPTASRAIGGQLRLDAQVDRHPRDDAPI